jgi:hypothetical protein
LEDIKKQKNLPSLLGCLRLTGKFTPHFLKSLFFSAIQFHLQESVHEESDTCHQGNHNTSNKNNVDDLVVLMLDIPDFRVSTDLLPKHDDLQEPKVIKLGGTITSLLQIWVLHSRVSTPQVSGGKMIK